ncbi:pyridoxamine 5'-phosphate oxidase family protein [Georgenia sp. SYP-B2076]|uniref:pyridoxamine 5'-phosphate oxidase family protein n=1 Tax=Georgenia sp. SYP-B2076 TaxID=2495881 RepID=UPI000F8CA2A4|nr:pyridoxamine 5'-phosphate oxidase family protein [Georgenia sp. SYP-B2076]
MAPDTYLEGLSRADCLRLLATVPIGWLAYCGSGRPHLVPVNFVVHENEVVVATGYGGKLAAAARDAVMAFGVESIDVGNRTGWSVTVTGRAQLMGDPLVNAARPAVDSWVIREEAISIAIGIEDISGRRIATTDG